MANTTHDSAVVQKFLDTNQYTTRGVLRYERIFGRTFVSTGGKETTEDFLKLLKLKPGDSVLDVGCGIGGSAFLMDLQYGAKVRGVDLSKNMLSLALERQKEVGSKNTTFHLEDVTKSSYKDNQFDLIYSRDAIFHIDDKVSLYKNFYKWIKPGGSLFVTEYACGEGETSKQFLKYVEQRDYKLVTAAQYKRLIQKAGFIDVRVTDLNEEFLRVLRRELEDTVAIKDEFIAEFSKEDYDDIVDGWKEKIERVEEGSQRWISVQARKPMSNRLKASRGPQSIPGI